MATYLVVMLRSGRELRIKTDAEADKMSAKDICTEFYEKVDLSKMATLRIDNYIVYCRDIEAFRFEQSKYPD